jgi:alpha-1,3-glucosyltransferase
VVEEHGSRLHGYIRDITDPNPKNKFLTDGSLADTSKPILYYISLDTGSDEITKLGCKEFSRDRKFYSKLVLKSFLRNAVSRENWTGAPWLVKEKLAAQYNISTQVPEAKTRDAIMAAKKAVNAANAAAASMPPPQHQPQPAEHGVTFFSYLAAQNQAQNPNQQAWPMDSNRPMPKPQKQTSIADFTRQQQPQQPFQLPPHLNGRITQYMPLPGQNGVSPPFHHMQPGNPLPINLPFQNQFMQYQVIAPTAPPPHHQAPPAPPPIKYPIEDLDIVLRPNAPERPALKFFSDDVPAGCDPPEQKTGILMKSMGALLCIWETLNVHETVFHLDSFTFDDFVEAMLYKSDGEDCELFTEAHCAVLSQLIAENGRVLVALPKVEDSEDGSGDGETSTLTSPEPEVEEAPPARNTRSSLAKSEAAALAKRSPTPVETKLVHKAAEFLTEYDWINRCASRDYVSGGWQSMMVGLIYNVSFIPGQKEICEDILAKLVPVDDEPMVESVKANYDQLDVNLRAAALEIACMLSVRTEIFRSELSKAGEEMTKIRKQKIEHQREKKVL